MHTASPAASGGSPTGRRDGSGSRALASFRKLLLAEGAHFDLIRPAGSADAAMEIVRDAG